MGSAGRDTARPHPSLTPAVRNTSTHPIPILSFWGRSDRNRELRGVASTPTPSHARPSKILRPFWLRHCRLRLSGHFIPCTKLSEKVIPSWRLYLHWSHAKNNRGVVLPKRASIWKSPSPPRLLLTPCVMFRVWPPSPGGAPKDEGSLRPAGTAEPRAAAGFQFSAPSASAHLPGSVISSHVCVRPGLAAGSAARPSQALPAPWFSSLNCPWFGLPTSPKCPPNTSGNPVWLGIFFFPLAYICLLLIAPS